MKYTGIKKTGLKLLFICFFTITAYSQQKSNVLIFSKTDEFRHKSIEAGIESVKKLGKENNFMV